MRGQTPTEAALRALPPLAPDLAGRLAVCSCCTETRPSSFALPYFVYRGPGSREARELCVCGYYRSAHQPPADVIAKGWCAAGEFRPQGPSPFDLFYCGCTPAPEYE